MQRWIQHAEKPLRHSDYTDIITEIYGSNNFSPDFGQMSLENIVGKKSFHRTFRLWLNEWFIRHNIARAFAKVTI